MVPGAARRSLAAPGRVEEFGALRDGLPAGGRRREVGMDAWGWEQFQPGLELRRELQVGPLLCTINCFVPHQLRHAHAVEMAREGVPLIVIQRQLGHSNLGITSVYVEGIYSGEIIETVHARRAPIMPVSVSMQL